MTYQVVPFPGATRAKSAPPQDAAATPVHTLFDDLVVEFMRSLKEVLRTPILGSAEVMKRRLDAAALIITTASAHDRSYFAPPSSKASKARRKRLAALQAEIEELKLEATRVQAEAAVAALKRRPR